HSPVSAGIDGIERDIASVSGYSKDWNVGEPGLSSEKAYHLEPIQYGHVDIGYYQVRALGFSHIQTRPTVFSSYHREPLQLQELGHDLAGVSTVIDDQDFLHFAVSSGSLTAHGFTLSLTCLISAAPDLLGLIAAGRLWCPVNTEDCFWSIGTGLPVWHQVETWIRGARATKPERHASFARFAIGTFDILSGTRIQLAFTRVSLGHLSRSCVRTRCLKSSFRLGILPTTVAETA